MNTTKFIEKAVPVARCLLLVSLVIFLFPATSWSLLHFLDNFDGNTLNSVYWPFDEKEQDSYVPINGWLRISAAPQQDLWEEPYKRGAPLVLYPVNSIYKYWAETLVSASPVSLVEEPSQPMDTQMGLFVYQDINHWFFFGLTNHSFESPGTQNGLMITKMDGKASIVDGMDLTEDHVYLKILKNGSKWEFFYKLTHDADWISWTTMQFPIGNHWVGMGVKTFDYATNSCEGNFDYFEIKQLFTLGPVWKIPYRFWAEWKKPWPWEIVTLVCLCFVVLIYFIVRRVFKLKSRRASK